ncbi:MAG TPA: alpha/beta hydrolase [Ktedonobacterales bacterium]
MDMQPARDGFVTAGAIRFHEVQWGTQGTPVVCVHGITANAFCFQALADQLAGDHQMFAYDLRGRGDSDKPATGYGVLTHAGDLAALIDVWGLERPVVIGHSMGAFIALAFAAQHPTRLSKLVLIDGGVPLLWKSAAEQPAWLTAAISRLGTPVPSFELYTQRLKAAPFLGPYWNAYLDLYYQHDVQRWPDGSVVARCYREACLEDEQSLHAEGMPESLWPQVTVPTLLLRAGLGLVASDDQMMAADAAALAQRTIPDCRLVDFPTLNHYSILFGAAPGPFEAIRAFLIEQ